MGQTHSNIVKGHTERAMVEQDTMVLAKDTEKELTKVSFNLAETSEESLSEEEEIDDDFDEDLEEGKISWNLNTTLDYLFRFSY